ncbi:metal ABC transporter substrate-binding protein [Ignavibacterium sp.]|uniref:metal ABC transporter substrate-binding protein n=1 Tax=Ignavibacterium sp. TaxID=2651167 RepID=UPI00307D9CA7
MKIRKILLSFSILLLIVGCVKDRQDKTNIVVTIYPFKSIIKEIAGDKVKIDVLLPAGADPHTYEMSPSDLIKIQNAKIFFYGAESLDGWAAKVDAEKKIELLKLIPKEFLIDIKSNDDHSHHADDKNHIYYGVDPHFWNDPLTVNSILDSLTEILSSLYPNDKDFFKHNAMKFSEKLVELDKKIKEQTKSLESNKVFSAHPFYNYFFNRYGIEVVGSLEISPGQQITPKSLKNISEEISRKNVKAIFINRQHISKPAQLLAEYAKIKLVELDPMGGTNNLTTYENIILNNLNLIIKALR